MMDLGEAQAALLLPAPPHPLLIPGLQAQPLPGFFF